VKLRSSGKRTARDDTRLRNSSRRRSAPLTRPPAAATLSRRARGGGGFALLTALGGGAPRQDRAPVRASSTRQTNRVARRTGFAPRPSAPRRKAPPPLCRPSRTTSAKRASAAGSRVRSRDAPCGWRGANPVGSRSPRTVL